MVRVLSLELLAFCPGNDFLPMFGTQIEDTFRTLQITSQHSNIGPVAVPVGRFFLCTSIIFGFQDMYPLVNIQKTIENGH